MIDDKIRDISNKISQRVGSGDDDEEDIDDIAERGDGDLRNRLRETGGEIRVEKSQIPELMSFLSSQRVEDRVNASRALVEVAQHYPDAVEEELHEVITLLDDEDNKVRKHACITLGVVGSEDAIDELEEVMDGADEEVKIAAEKAIRHIRKQHSGEVEAVSDQSTDDGGGEGEDRPDWAGDRSATGDEPGGGDEASAAVDTEDEQSPDADDEITADDDRPEWAGGTADDDEVTEPAEDTGSEDEDEEEGEEETVDVGSADATDEAPSSDDADTEDEGPVDTTGADDDEGTDDEDEEDEAGIDEIPAASTGVDGDDADEGGEETDAIKEVPGGESGMDDTSEETSAGAAGQGAADGEGGTGSDIASSIDEAIEDIDEPVTELPRLVLLYLLGQGDESTREDIEDAVNEVVETYPDAVADSATEFVDAVDEDRQGVSRFASTVVDAITEAQPQALEDDISYLVETAQSADEDLRDSAKDALTRIAERSPDKLVDELAESDE